MAEGGVSFDPGAILWELIQLRYRGNVTALARELAGPQASKDDIHRWRNYLNRWKRGRDQPNRHDPSDEHIQALARALSEPVNLLRLLWAQDAVARELRQLEAQLARAARAASGGAPS